METKLEVKGMTCGHCENAVRKALAGVQGVTEVVEVDWERERAVVRGDADHEALVRAITEEGYKARVA